MNRLRGLTRWQRYVLAFLLTGAALLVSLPLRPVIQQTPAIILVVAILLSAWTGGPGPGILSALLSALALRFFFFPPSSALFPTSVNNGLDLLIFLVVVLVISTVAARVQRGHAITQTTAERAEQLQMVTAALSQALTPGQVADVIMRQGVAALRARTISLVVLSPDGQWLDNVAHLGYPPEVVPKIERYPISTSMTAGDVARTGQAVWLESTEAIRARYPERDDLLRAIGHRAVAGVPLNLEGRLLGVLVITFVEPVAFTPDVRRYIATLADCGAEALGRARQYEAEQQARQAAEEAGERQARLTDMVAALSRSMTREQVAQAFLEQGLRLLGASAGSVVALVGEGEMANLASAGYPAAVREQWARFALTAPIPLAEAARDGRPVWIGSAAELEQRYPQLAGTPEQTHSAAMAVLPLAVDGRTLGSLGLGFSQPQAFNPQWQALALALAQECAQALDRAQAYTDLEEMVRQRSQALEAANADLQREIKEREQAQAQLSDSNEQLRALAADLQVAREEERRRLAREIHDELGGTLTGLKMEVARIQRGLADKSDELSEVLKVIDQSVQTVRSIATELRPAILDDFGVVAAIEWLAQDFQSRTEIECRLVTELESVALAPEANIGVYRVVQESLTNVARHAHATQATIYLDEEPGCLVVRVQDNGQGFVAPEGAPTRTLGLAGMRERARAMAGKLQIDSAPGRGTTITLSLPRPTGAQT